jgi:hypothetical protein
MKPVQQAEILLRLAENNEDKGDDVNAEINRLGREHANALLEELDLLNKAIEINRIGRERFAHFMPRQAQPHSISTAAANRLLQGGKDETAQAKEQRPATASAGQRP